MSRSVAWGFFALLSCLLLAPSPAHAEGSSIDPELLDAQQARAQRCTGWKKGERRLKQGPCWGDRTATYALQLHGGALLPLPFFPGTAHSITGAGLRLERTKPVGRIVSFQMRAGFLMGTSRPPVCHPQCTSDDSVGRGWAVDVDLALGLHLGSVLLSVGPSLGFALVKGFENAEDQGLAIVSVATVDLAWTFSRRYPARLGVRGSLFLTLGGSLYLSFPLQGPFETTGQR